MKIHIKDLPDFNPGSSRSSMAASSHFFGKSGQIFGQIWQIR